MERLILARHAESDSNHTATVNGVVPGDALTPAGREQARALGRALASEPLELAVVTEFRRTHETADLAIDGREVPRLVVPELNEIGFGRFEGGLLADYRGWAWEAPADEPCPGGGESRGGAAARYARAFETLLARPEGVVLVVTHALPVRYLLGAAAGRAPVARLEPVPHAEPFRLERAAVVQAVDVLRWWADAPFFA